MQINAPSRLDKAGSGTKAGQTLTVSSSIRRRGWFANKNPGAQKRQGRGVFEQTDSPLALFFVVAISRATDALNQSTSTSNIHREPAQDNSFNGHLAQLP